MFLPCCRWDAAHNYFSTLHILWRYGVGARGLIYLYLFLPHLFHLSPMLGKGISNFSTHFCSSIFSFLPWFNIIIPVFFYLLIPLVKLSISPLYLASISHNCFPTFQQVKLFGSKLLGNITAEGQEVQIEGLASPGVIHKDGLLITGTDGNKVRCGRERERESRLRASL